MDYFERIRCAIDFTEANLGEEITLADLAGRAYFSVYHFHRVFQGVAGETVMEYVRKRRLTEAARDLIRTRRKIIDIALGYGFGSPETFTRTFRKAYGLTPGVYREKRQERILLERGRYPGTKVRHYVWRCKDGSDDREQRLNLCSRL